MMEPAHGVQIVTVEDDHSYHLNQEELEKILLNNNIQDLPVAVVSVAGAYRGGKSFLLNFFLKYLTAEPSAREDGSWMGGPEDELTGFSWRGGSERNTTGILMWSEPFVVTLPTQEKVAVLLIDTQGTFDSTSTFRDCSTIFAMSTLISSTQIYNLRGNINEQDLQNLQLFMDYGKLMKTESGKPFQALEFLIRDWANDFEYEFGQAGGDLYLAEKFKAKPDQAAELQELHQHIFANFEKVTCFLMPHPGLRVRRLTFKGQTKDISEEFCEELKRLVPSIFSPESLVMKRIGGQRVTSRDLLQYFTTYMTIFNSKDIPSPRSIFVATSEVGFLKACKEVREQFEKSMESACGVDAPSMAAADVIDLHTQYLTAARDAFNAKILMGDKKDIEAKRDELIQELTDRQKEFITINMSKTMRAIQNGFKAYDRVVESVSKEKPLCLHPHSITKLHDDAVSAAVRAFSEKRKVAQGRFDVDKIKFEKDLAGKLEALERTNDQNNKAMITKLKNDYFQNMLAHTNSTPNLCPAPFEEMHNLEKQKALTAFEERRNQTSSFEVDAYKTDMLQGINIQYQQLKEINASKEKVLFQKVLQKFELLSAKSQYLRRKCTTPNILRSEHDQAKQEAMDSIEPMHLCGQDSYIIQKHFYDRYETLKTVNDAANRAAESAAYWAYKNRFNSLSSHWYYAFQSWDTILDYHYQALNAGDEEFKSRRRDRYAAYSYYDEYYRNYRDIVRVKQRSVKSPIIGWVTISGIDYERFRASEGFVGLKTPIPEPATGSHEKKNNVTDG